MFRDSDIKKLFVFELVVGILFFFVLFSSSVSHSVLFLFFLFFFLSNLLFFLYLFRLHQKVQHLSQYMNRILNNDYSFDIRDYQEGDLSNLKNDIYKMTVKLKEQSSLAINDKKYLEDVLSDISHQLKTPLTSMYVMNDILLTDSQLEEEKKKEFLMKNRAQLERIEWLVSSLLKMSRLDSGSEVLHLQPVSCQQFLKKVVAPLSIPIELKNQTLILPEDSSITLIIDENWTVEAFVNILKNAHEHTKEKGTITITCRDTPLFTEFQISDNGEGISATDLPHIFERFYKGKKTSDSIGIGLYMAKKIITLEKGEIQVTSRKKGTCFQIRFYKQK